MNKAPLRQLIHNTDEELQDVLNLQSPIDNKIMEKWLELRNEILNEIGDDDCVGTYIERDYCPESDRTTMYQITMNCKTGEVETIELIGWYYGRPHVGDEHKPETHKMKAIL